MELVGCLVGTSAPQSVD